MKSPAFSLAAFPVNVSVCVLPRVKTLLPTLGIMQCNEQVTSCILVHVCTHAALHCSCPVCRLFHAQAPLAVPVAGAGGEGAAGAHGDLCSAEVMHAAHAYSEYNLSTECVPYSNVFSI